MNYIIENWALILGLGALLIAGGVAIKHYFDLPSKDQIAKIKEWLLYAVTEAEAQMGSGTGQLKLRLVYDLFVGRYPIVAKVISFELFSKWVDEALDKMQEMLDENPAIAALVEVPTESVGTE